MIDSTEGPRPARGRGGRSLTACVLACVGAFLILYEDAAAITFVPATPMTRQSVDFTAGPVFAPVGWTVTIRSQRWDLDDDGSFDDGQGVTARRSFDVGGAHPVHWFFDYQLTRCTGDICQTSAASGVQHATVNVRTLGVDVSGAPAHVETGQPVQVSITSSPDDVAVSLLTDVAGRSSPFTGSAFSHAFSAPGIYTFATRATDGFGNVATDTSPVTVGPDTRLEPVDVPLVSPRPSAEFAFSSSVPGMLFECRLDPPAAGGGWQHPCGSRVLTGLQDGGHIFEVRAVSPTEPALVDPTPSSFSWTVDTVAPKTEVIGPPDGFLTSERTIAFSFSASEPEVSFECSLDAAPFASCPAGNAARYGELAEGLHLLLIRAVDRAGNVESPAIQRSWRVTRDNDRDGELFPDDCDDNDARLHHGALDLPQNGLNEDCAGGDSPFPPVPTSILISYKGARHGLRVASLVVKRVLEGTTVEVRCKGRSCRRKRYRRTFSKARAEVQLRRVLRRSVLRQGAVLEVRAIKAERLGRVRRDRIGRRGATTESLCLDPRRPTQSIGHIDRTLRPRAERRDEECS